MSIETLSYIGSQDRLGVDETELLPCQTLPVEANTYTSDVKEGNPLVYSGKIAMNLQLPLMYKGMSIHEFEELLNFGIYPDRLCG